MSNFDPQAFLEMSIDQPLEKRPLIPVQLYMAEIIDLKPVLKDKQNDDGSTRQTLRFDVALKLSIPAEVREQQGIDLESLTLTDYVTIDRNQNGGIDTTPGKNNRLRIYREAADLNRPGEPFMPAKLIGRVVGVKIRHEEYPIGSGNFNEKVDGVVRWQ